MDGWIETVNGLFFFLLDSYSMMIKTKCSLVKARVLGTLVFRTKNDEMCSVVWEERLSHSQFRRSFSKPSQNDSLKAPTGAVF